MGNASHKSTAKTQLLALIKTPKIGYNTMVILFSMTPKPPVVNTKNVNSSGNADDFFSTAESQAHLSDLIPKQEAPHMPAHHGKRRLKIILGLIIAVIAVLGLFVVARAGNFMDKIFVGNNHSLYSRISDLVSSQTGSKLIGESNGQVNVLLLGIGGPGHDGPYLSDTIIVAQLRPKDKKATLISIPRDYLVNTKEIGQRKINAVFAESYEKNKDWEKAGQSTIDVVEKISGLEIPYFAVVDFEGFKKSVDMLGGIEVTVQRPFTDYTFPDNKGGYIAPVSFEEGTEKMSGERALIYARSRHASGPEGSDFARGLRQQQIIHAAKSKVTALNLIKDAGKINELFTIVGDHFHTNMTPGEMIKLYTLSNDYGQENIVSLSLDPTTELVCNEVLEESGAFVVTLCPGKTTDDIHDFFSQSFSSGQIQSENAVVWLADSSTAQNLYKKAEAELTAQNLTVYKIIYTGKPLTQTVVYPVNRKEATINLIKNRLKASEVSLAPPGIKIDPKKVDVIIILGSEE